MDPRGQVSSEAALRRTTDRREKLIDRLRILKNNLEFESTEDSPIVLRKGERLRAIITDVVLLETRRAAAERISGGIGGRLGGGLFGGVSVSVLQPAEEVPTYLDDGTVVVSSQRTAFIGKKQSREWPYPKLLTVEYQRLPQGYVWAAVHVSNRQRLSGFAFHETALDEISFRVALSIADFTGNGDAVVAALEQELAALDSTPRSRMK